MAGQVIEIYTFIGRNSAAYAELLYGSFEQLKSGCNKVVYNCIKSIGADSMPEHWNCISEVKEKMEFNNQNHARAMHEALKFIKHRNIIFVDADMCILYKDWDKIVLRELWRGNEIWGTAFGNDSLQYHNFPNVFFLCFNKELLNKVSLDFYPQQRQGIESPMRREITNEIESDCFNKEAGSIIKCDTGWRLPLTIKRAGISYDYLPRVLGNEKESQLPYKNDMQRAFCLSKPEHMAEWHYKGKLFCTHKQASRNHALNSDWGKAWKERIDLYTQKEFNFVL